MWDPILPNFNSYCNTSLVLQYTMFNVAIEVSGNKSSSVAVDPYGNCAKCNAEKALSILFFALQQRFFGLLLLQAIYGVVTL